jgi:PucR C-terminal helix-turn-helix domain/GGDEF-like domain
VASGDFFTRLKARRDATSVTIRDAMVGHVRGYAMLPSAGQGILLGEVHETWDVVLRQAEANEPLKEADLEVFRDLGRRRGWDAFPFDDVRAGFDVAYVSGLQDCIAVAEGGDPELPMAFTAWGSHEQSRIVQAVMETYVMARREAGDHGQANELVLRHLLNGTSAAAAADAAGMALPRGYLVLLCRPQGSVEFDAAVQRSVMERVIETGPGVLWRGDPLRGKLLVLLPVEEDPAVTQAVAANLTAALARTIGRRLHAAEALAATPDAVPAAFGEAQQAITLVAAMPDAESRPYRTEELLIELAVARQPEMRQRLIDLLAPLTQGTDLQHTLAALFDCGLDREKTARALYIHRRTLTYRIKRIRELTGLDPTTAHGIQLLRAALIATRIPFTTPRITVAR